MSVYVPGDAQRMFVGQTVIGDRNLQPRHRGGDDRGEVAYAAQRTDGLRRNRGQFVGIDRRASGRDLWRCSHGSGRGDSSALNRRSSVIICLFRYVVEFYT